MTEAGESPRVLFFGHRGGSMENYSEGRKGQNSIPRAVEALSKGIPGVEIDVRITKDGVSVVTHDNVSKITFDEFKDRYSKHATLESWIDWFSQEQLKDRSIYLDLKDQNIDAFALMEAVACLGERVVIGSKDPQTVAKLLLARRILSAEGKEKNGSKIVLQIPDPLYGFSVEYAKNLARNAGLGHVQDELLINLKPDGLHFFFPENIAREAVAEAVGHGEFVPLSEKTGKRKFRRFPNIPGLHNLQRLRLKKFVKKAVHEGFFVVAGSATGRDINKRMINWGVKAIMPNVPDYLPENASQLMRSANITPPEDNFKNEQKEQSPEKDKYLEIVTRMKKRVGMLRQQVGV